MSSIYIFFQHSSGNFLNRKYNSLIWKTLPEAKKKTENFTTSRGKKLFHEGFTRGGLI